MRKLAFELLVTMENLFAYSKKMIINSLKRTVPSIVMFMLADNMLVKDLQNIINKQAWLRRGTLHFAISVLMKSQRLPVGEPK